MAYLRDRDLGAPEEVLEGLRQYVELAADMLKPKPSANDNAMMLAQPGMPMDPAAMPMDPAMGGMPGQPTAALAPEAMNLMAS
jgi:hypothetical protein